MRALDRVFVRKEYVLQYAWEHPLLRFCHQVGRKNVARLTKIKIEGHLHTCIRDDSDRRPGGLGRVMQVYTTILREICKDLRSLTLHIGYDAECVNMTRVAKWMPFDCTEDDDIHDDKGKSDEEKLNRIVGHVVRELKGLQHLQLGDYKKATIRSIPVGDMKWGMAVKWMEVIKQRAEGVNAAGEYTGLSGLDNKRLARNHGNRRGGYRGGGRGGFRGRGNGRGLGNGREGRGRNLAEA